MRGIVLGDPVERATAYLLRRVRRALKKLHNGTTCETVSKSDGIHGGRRHSVLIHPRLQRQPLPHVQVVFYDDRRPLQRIYEILKSEGRYTFEDPPVGTGPGRDDMFILDIYPR